MAEPRVEGQPQQSEPQTRSTQQEGRVGSIDKAMGEASVQKEYWDAAMRHKRLARIQEAAGFTDLADAENQKAELLRRNGREAASQSGEAFDDTQRKKFESLSHLLEETERLRQEVTRLDATREISLDKLGIPFDDDTKALLNIGGSGYPPLKIVEADKGHWYERGQIIYPVEDDMVLVEKYEDQDQKPLKREHTLRIMGRADKYDMGIELRKHIARFEQRKATARS